MRAEKVVVCVVVLGPDNAPLFLKKFTESDSLTLDVMVFEALEIVGNRPVKPGTNHFQDRFLGCVRRVGQTQVWWFQSPLRYKIAVITDTLLLVREPTVKVLCDGVFQGLCKAIMNPFYRPFGPIIDPTFEKEVVDMSLRVQVIAPPHVQ
jgi:hypothetical protein